MSSLETAPGGRASHSPRPQGSASEYRRDSTGARARERERAQCHPPTTETANSLIVIACVGVVRPAITRVVRTVGVGERTPKPRSSTHKTRPPIPDREYPRDHACAVAEFATSFLVTKTMPRLLTTNSNLNSAHYFTPLPEHYSCYDALVL